jgi:hypothetical protein
MYQIVYADQFDTTYSETVEADDLDQTLTDITEEGYHIVAVWAL